MIGLNSHHIEEREEAGLIVAMDQCTASQEEDPGILDALSHLIGPLDQMSLQIGNTQWGLLLLQLKIKVQVEDTKIIECLRSRKLMKPQAA